MKKYVKKLMAMLMVMLLVVTMAAPTNGYKIKAICNLSVGQ